MGRKHINRVWRGDWRFWLAAWNNPEAGRRDRPRWLLGQIQGRTVWPGTFSSAFQEGHLQDARASFYPAVSLRRAESGREANGA